MTPRTTRRKILCAPLAALALAAAGPALAQGQPPLRVILPLGAGSGVDVIVRSAQAALSRALGGQPVIVENLPGAGGITGTQAIVKAAADGSTVGVVSNNHVVNPSVYRKMPYDGIADLTPVSVVGGSPFVLVVNPAKVPAKTAGELAAFLRAKPDGYNYGSSGNGTIIHLAGAMFMDEADAQVRHVPYKGMGPMLTDLIGGQIEVAVAAVPAVQGHLKSGALRAIGVMGRQRVASLPDLPTIAEQGMPAVDVAGWFAFVAPKGVPTAQVKRLHEAVVAAFSDPEVRAAMARQDNFISPTSPEEALRFFRAEQERYGRLVRRIGLTLD